jgi:hypothetical protein
MSSQKKILLTTGFYFLISFFLGLFVSSAFQPIESKLFASLMIGPSIVFNRAHGLEFYLLATIICLPCLWGAFLFKKIILKIMCASVFIAVWFSLGIFLR